MTLMNNCETKGCNQWAQCIKIEIAKDDKGKVIAMKIRKLLCVPHQMEEEKLNKDENIKFRFIGAVPRGVDYTKYR